MNHSFRHLSTPKKEKSLFFFFAAGEDGEGMRRVFPEGLSRFWPLGCLGIGNFGFGVQNDEVRKGAQNYRLFRIGGDGCAEELE